MIKNTLAQLNGLFYHRICGYMNPIIFKVMKIPSTFGISNDRMLVMDCLPISCFSGKFVWIRKSAALPCLQRLVCTESVQKSSIPIC